MAFTQTSRMSPPDRPRIAGFQGVELGGEELGLGAAGLASLLRVAVEGVVREIADGARGFLGESLGDLVRRLPVEVVEEADGVVGGPGLASDAEVEDRLGDEHPALGGGWARPSSGPGGRPVRGPRRGCARSRGGTAGKGVGRVSRGAQTARVKTRDR